MSTGKLLSVSFANLQAASDTTNAKLVTADLKTMSMAQLDLYFTLGIIGTVMYNTRQYQSMSIQTLSKWIDDKGSTWAGSVNTDYVILNILGKDGTMILYCKVTRGGTESFDAYPILGKIPGKPWRWSKNVTASEIGGVIYCPISLKGGVRHEYGWNSPHGREAERVAAERDGVQRGRCKPRYMHATWDISDYLSYDMCITATASRSTLAICSRGSSCSRRGSLSKTDMQERMRSSSDCKWNRNKLEHYGFGLNLLAYGKEVAA